jgi:hypothetical protein
MSRIFQPHRENVAKNVRNGGAKMLNVAESAISGVAPRGPEQQGHAAKSIA